MRLHHRERRTACFATSRTAAGCAVACEASTAVAVAMLQPQATTLQLNVYGVRGCDVVESWPKWRRVACVRVPFLASLS